MTKRGYLTLHKYCGLVASLLILVQALTGMAIVYRDGLARWLDPVAMARRTTGADLSPGMILLAAQHRFPGAQVRRLVFPKSDDGVYFVWLGGDGGAVTYATIDPGNGAVISSGNIWRYPVEAALSLHYQLLGGKMGTAIVMLTGLSLLALIVSGLVYWWPRGNRLLKALVVRRNIPARFAVRQLHRSVGVIVSMLLGISAVTGLVMVVDLLQGSAPNPAWPAGAQRLERADRAFRLASAEFPGYPVRDIRMPSPERMNVYFRTVERNPESASSVAIDLPSLRIVGRNDARLSTDPLVTLLSIHNGKWVGPVGKMVVFVLGIGLAFLAITGPLGWYLVARRQKRSSGAQRAGA